MTSSLKTRRGFTQLPSKVRRGFTLIALIIVIAIIAVIAAGTFVALDPARSLHARRNSKRWTDVTAVLQAVKTYQTDSSTSALPFTIDGTTTTVQVLGLNSPACTSIICAGAGMAAVGACLPATNLTSYLASIPFDPSTGSANETRYYINSANGIVTVGACDAEGEAAGGGGTAPAISVTN